MKRAWNIIWKIALVLLVPGLAIGITGAAMGDVRPVAWWHGPKVLSQHDINIDEPNLDAFTYIDVNAVIMNIQVVVGDHFGLKVNITKTLQNVTWSDTNGTLTLRESAPAAVFFPFTGFSPIDREHGQVVITVPSTANLTAVSLFSTTGQISMDAPCERLSSFSTTGNITLPSPASIQMDATSSTGDIKVTGGTASITAHTTTGQINIQGGADIETRTSTGDTTITGPGGPVTAKSSTGNVTISGGSAGNEYVAVTTTTGQISVTQSTAWADTWYDLTSTTGHITTNGAGAPGSSGHHITGGNTADSPPLMLQITTTTGGINIRLGS